MANNYTFLQTLVYHDVKLTISDQSVFNIPAMCMNTMKPQPLTNKVCFAPTLEAKIDLFGGVTYNVSGKQMGALQRGTLMLYASTALGRVVTKGSVMQDNMTYPVHTISDYSVTPAVEYVVMNGSCTKNVPYLADYGCLPSDTMVEGSFVLGDPMFGQNLTTYSFNKDGWYMRIAMSSHGIPSVQEQSGHMDNADVIQTLNYYDVKTSISDMSVFDMPAMCMAQTTMPPATTKRVMSGIVIG